jgi:hypothetical protein
MLCTEFCVALYKLRTTQARFAEWLGNDVTTVNRWARGKRPVPREIELLLHLTQFRADVLDGLEPDQDAFAPLDEFSFDDYAIMGFNYPVGPESIKRAYRNLMKIYHPDCATGNLQAAQKLTAAYGRLSKKEGSKT